MLTHVYCYILIMFNLCFAEVLKLAKLVIIIIDFLVVYPGHSTGITQGKMVGLPSLSGDPQSTVLTRSLPPLPCPNFASV